MMKKKNINSKSKLSDAFSLFILSLKNSPKYDIIVVVSSFLSTFKKISFVLLPPLLVSFLLAGVSTEQMIIVVIIYSLILFFADSTGLGLRLLETSYGYVANNLASLRVGQKGMNIAYDVFEDSTKLDQFQRARSSTWIFSDMVDCTLGKIIPISFSLFISIYYIGQTGVLALTIVCLLAALEELIMSMKKRTEYRVKTECARHERKKQYLNYLLCDLRYAKEIRLFDMLFFLLTRKEECENRIIKLEKKKERTVLFYIFLKNTLRFFQLTVVYYYALDRFISGGLQPEIVLLVVASIRLLSDGIQSVVAVYVDIKELSRYYYDYRLFMQFPDDITNGISRAESTDEAKNGIKFENVSFRYPKSNKYALKNINLTIRHGEKIAFVGENGSGKTTLVKLLCCLYKPTKGKIIFGNTDLQSLDIGDFRKRLIPVFQDVNLHKYSLRENIAFDARDDQRIVKLMNEHGLRTLLTQLPFGIDTYVTQELSKKGRDFSGGERQRLSYIRALFKAETNVEHSNYNIFLLDEPTAAIDSLAELDYAEDMLRSVGDDTTIFITHRLANVRNCDRIIVLNEGVICEMGSFSELMKKGDDGIFRNMYLMQAEMYHDWGRGKNERES